MSCHDSLYDIKLVMEILNNCEYRTGNYRLCNECREKVDLILRHRRK